jgi:D-arabinose 1-dehydrogenase-like Zn-dependent alcohol dehydrogenase
MTLPGSIEIHVKVVSTSVCRSDVLAWQSKVHALTYDLHY